METNNKQMVLDSNYTIERDSYNVILKYYNEGEINPDTEKPTITKVEYYYPSLETALIAYTNKVANYGNDIQALLDELKTLRGTITSLVKENSSKLK
jgi:hypothetical protein